MNEMKSRLQVLCVAMNQNDLTLVEKLNVSSDLIIANQSDSNNFIEKTYPWGNVKMVSTNTRGVGKNRNTAFLYAEDEILLLSDDDMRYSDSYVDDILGEFDRHPDADVIIFNITSSDPKRPQKQNASTKQLYRFSRLPYGGPRIAIRKSSWEESNVWFTTLFGGGAKYSNGEDSLFLADLQKKGLVMYVSKVNIGTVSMDESSWFKGTNEEFYFNKGALCAVAFPKTKYLRMVYFSLRLRSSLRFSERIRWFYKGINAYRKHASFAEEA